MSKVGWGEMLSDIRLVVSKCGSERVDVCKADILATLRKYVSNETDFKQYIHYSDSGYTKNLIETIGDDCNIILMCWGPGQSSALHGHEGSKCFVKVLAGHLAEQRVDYPSEECLLDYTEETLNPNDVSYIDESDGVHKVINKSSTKPAITLHIYLPPYKKCRIFKENSLTISVKNSELLDVQFYFD